MAYVNMAPIIQAGPGALSGLFNNLQPFDVPQPQDTGPTTQAPTFGQRLNQAMVSPLFGLGAGLLSQSSGAK
jgi:hypothetical protein